MKKIVDTLVKAVRVGESLYNTLKDGFQPLQDGIVIWQQVPGITSIAQEAKAAWTEGRSLPADQYDALLDNIAAELDLTNDAAEARVRRIVGLLGRTVREVEGDLAVLKAWKKTFAE
jgi:hypothetical protein